MTEYKKPINPGTSATEGSFVYVKVIDVDLVAKTAYVVDQLGMPKTISLTRSYGNQYTYPEPGEEWIATRQFGDWILAIAVKPQLTEIDGVVKAGSAILFMGSVIPNGWYAADGSAKDRIIDSTLFAAIGTRYGSGDGSTTFNLPTLTAATGTYIIKR